MFKTCTVIVAFNSWCQKKKQKQKTQTHYIYNCWNDFFLEGKKSLVRTWIKVHTTYLYPGFLAFVLSFDEVMMIIRCTVSLFYFWTRLGFLTRYKCLVACKWERMWNFCRENPSTSFNVLCQIVFMKTFMLTLHRICYVLQFCFRYMLMESLRSFNV